jgi:hypothetical protein
LAGHVDVRTTQIYVDVSDRRTADGIGALERIPVRWRRSRLRGQTAADDGDHSSILAADDRAYRCLRGPARRLTIASQPING